MFNTSLKIYPIDSYLSLFCSQRMQCAVDGKKQEIKYV